MSGYPNSSIDASKIIGIAVEKSTVLNDEVLIYDASVNKLKFGAMVGVALAGGDKQIQFNDGGALLGANAGFTYDKTTGILTSTGMKLSNGGVAKGLLFGDNAGGYDVNLYRSAANVLKTDDTFNSAAFQCGATAGLASQVVALAKITPGGADGSITVTGGIVTAYTAPT